MPEPTSTTVVGLLATGVGVAALLPGVNGDALIGAFAGGTLFAVSAAQVPLWRRIVYLGLSMIAGYLAAEDVQRLIFIRSSGLAAFLAAALVVTLTLAAIERCKTFDFSWLRRGGPPNA